MTDRSVPAKFSFEVFLAEYNALAAAIADAIKRMETIRGLYLAGAFAGIGWLITSQPGALAAAIGKIQTDSYLLTAILLAPLVNSLLLTYVASLMHYILAAAKYNSYVLRPQLERHTGETVLQFDFWASDDKHAWLALRTLSGAIYFVLVTSVSLGILATFARAGTFRHGWFPGVIFGTSVLSVSLSLTAGLGSVLISRRFHSRPKRAQKPLTWLYWLSFPLAAILYALLLVVNERAKA